MQLIDRALSALEILGKNLEGLSVSELSEALGIPASSTHRILSSLKANHFVLQDEETKRYRLGYKICCGDRHRECADHHSQRADEAFGGKDRPECCSLRDGARSCHESHLHREKGLEYVHGQDRL